MASTRFRCGLVVLVTFVLTRGAFADSVSPRAPRIRPFEPRLHALVDRGLHDSPTFRALAARLEHSDVIVLIVTDACPPPGIAGRLTFLSARGSVRYVAVRLRPLASIDLEIAVLAHELQHAVEIADRASIVDEEALAREYAEIGHLNQTMPHGIAFDTRAAIDVGYRVHRELTALVDVGHADVSGE